MVSFMELGGGHGKGQRHKPGSKSRGHGMGAAWEPRREALRGRVWGSAPSPAKGVRRCNPHKFLTSYKQMCHVCTFILEGKKWSFRTSLLYDISAN
jgi:hypothetical protein